MKQHVLDYIRSNRDRYTREAIDAQLRETGNPQTDIDQAWATIERESTQGSRLMRSYWRYWWLLTLGVAAIATAVVASLSPSGEFYSPGSVATVLGVFMLIGLLLAAGIVALTSPRRQPFRSAAIVGAMVPLVVILLLAGICVGSFPKVY